MNIKVDTTDQHFEGDRVGLTFHPNDLHIMRKRGIIIESFLVKWLIHTWIWAIIMILIPLAMIFVYAFTTGGNSVRTFIFTLDNFAKVFSDKVFIEV